MVFQYIGLNSSIAFSPVGSTVTRAVTSTTARIARTSPTSAHVIRIANVGPDTAFVNFGTVTVTATVAAGIPILAGSIEFFTVGVLDTDVAAISNASETATLYITSGNRG